MRFTLTTDLINDYTFEQVKGTIIKEARRFILLSPMLSTEVKLNKYFIAKYKQPLKSVCLKLLLDCVISANKDNEITITFKHEKANKLAELITFGDGKMMGCDILIHAFKILQKKN